MAGKEETEEMMKENECAFEWDEDSKLYFHASSGFYHDPNAGWYYSSKDGLYYKFENGSYVRLEPDKDEELEALVVQREIISNEHIPDELCPVESIDGDKHENLPPPSEWLEETLIDLYLSGYSESAINDVNGPVMPSETDADYDPNLLLHANDDTYEREEGEWIPEEFQEATGLSGRLSDEDSSRLQEELISQRSLVKRKRKVKCYYCGERKCHWGWKCPSRRKNVGGLDTSHEEDERNEGVRGASLDEENWLSQYGQVQSEDDGAVAFRSVDLWDWAMVTETIKRNKRGKKKKLKIDRLVGRLVRPSTTLHPSMPSGGCILKTTAIREVHLSLVRVSSGQVYRLKSPSLKYFNSISIYDASDPTKDWGFPHLAVDEQNLHLSKYPCGTLDGISAREVLSVLPDQLRISEKHKIRGYRDRAAERRAFHGGFGVGPGQKNSADDVETTSSVSYSTDKAAAEALNMSFGAGSYARRMLENMGWKEGEALGSCTKGLVEPLNAVSNKGFAGLGWEQHHRS